MSSYFCKIKIKKTGEIKDCCALDGYYGNRQYGYQIKSGKTYSEDEVDIIMEKHSEEVLKDEPQDHSIRFGDISEWINYGKERGYFKYLKDK